MKQDSISRVTVLMPVYNGEKYLKIAIESILNQTFKNFEFLIINDGSTDRTDQIIKSFNDSRIIYIKNEHNLGIVKTLNKGLGLIKSEYIVRMDADDISYPKRIEYQVSFMDKNPRIAISGTDILRFDEAGKRGRTRVLTDSKSIRTQLLFQNALMHPTVIIRSSILIEGNYYYKDNFKACEDHALWLEISKLHEITNISKVLLDYRIHSASITRNANKELDLSSDMHLNIYEDVLLSFGIEHTQKDLENLRYFTKGILFSVNNGINDTAILLNKIKINLDRNRYDLKTFEETISRYFRVNCIKSGVTYKKAISLYKKYFSGLFDFDLLSKVKFLVKRSLLHNKNDKNLS